MTNEELIKLAIEEVNNSYSPYSKFKVGAAILTTTGKVFTGCNIENSAYSPSICAERVAIFKAISEGYKEFDKIAIVGGNLNEYCPPCGVCRQVMYEFVNDNFKIILGTNSLKYKEYSIKELLPEGFKL